MCHARYDLPPVQQVAPPLRCYRTKLLPYHACPAAKLNRRPSRCWTHNRDGATLPQRLRREATGWGNYNWSKLHFGGVGLMVNALDSRPGDLGSEFQPWHMGFSLSSMGEVLTHRCASHPSQVYRHIGTSFSWCLSPLCGYRGGAWLD
jgi:hypothetical protein